VKSGERMGKNGQKKIGGRKWIVAQEKERK
jgi:hypothetical protein